MWIFMEDREKKAALEALLFLSGEVRRSQL